MLHYELRGDCTLPMIVFLHGFLGDRRDFNSVICRLDRFCSLAIDLPGHGQSNFSHDYTIEHTASEIITLLDDLDIARSNLIGYSMGGRLALFLAVYYPDRFPKVVIESGLPGLKTEQARSTRLQHDRALATQIETNFDQFLIDWYNQPLFESFKAQPNFQELLEQRSQNDPIELARSLREMSTGKQPSLWKELETHRNPMLLMVGERDRKFIEINQEMASLCETATLAIVPNAGHNIHLEQPEQYADEIMAFLE